MASRRRLHRGNEVSKSTVSSSLLDSRFCSVDNWGDKADTPLFSRNGWLTSFLEEVIVVGWWLQPWTVAAAGAVK